MLALKVIVSRMKNDISSPSDANTFRIFKLTSLDILIFATFSFRVTWELF